MFSGGEGTIDNPFLVSTVEDFLAIHQNLAAHYLQVNDIDFAGVVATAIGKQFDPFTGTYDGALFSLDNMTVKNNGEEYVAIFAISLNSLQNIVTNNLTIITDDMSRTRCGLLTVVNGGTAHNCHVNGVIYDIASNSSDSSGGAGIANINEGVISRCSAEFKIEKTGFAAGLVVFNSGEIRDSYAFATVNDVQSVGTIVFQNTDGSVHNSYTVISIAEARYPHLPSESYNDEHNFYNSFFDCSVIALDDWDESKEYISNEIVVGTDGGSYQCLDGQPNEDYDYWDDSWNNTGPPDWWPGPYTRARPVDGEVWSEFWKSITQSNTEGARTTTQLKQLATFTGWDFNDIWDIREGETYPFLRRPPRRIKCKRVPLTNFRR